METPRIAQINQDKPVIAQDLAFVGMGHIPLNAPAYSVPTSPLMDDTIALMDDPLYLMGGTKTQGGEIPRLLQNDNTPRMKQSTERPSMKYGIS